MNAQWQYRAGFMRPCDVRMNSHLHVLMSQEEEGA